MLLRIAVTLMAFSALIWLVYEFYRLLWQPSHIGNYQVHPGAIDLKLRHVEVDRWFAGTTIYGELKTATYPPASYVILWPLLGWLDVTSATFFWAFTTIAALVWLIYLIVLESGANTALERIFVTLMPLSMYATGATVGNGQVLVHILPVLTAGLLLLQQDQSGWLTDLLAATLILLALVKPNVSVPFFWIVLFIPGRLRPALLLMCGYVAVTLFAASFQEPGVLSLIRDWITHAAEVSERASGWSYGNLHSWLGALGLEAWNIPASLLLLLTLGVWIYCHRHNDLWLLLGVTALVARFWTYHGWYDDLIILLPMMALFRMAEQRPYANGGDIFPRHNLYWCTNHCLGRYVGIPP
jgi:hypothetical protein